MDFEKNYREVIYHFDERDIVKTYYLMCKERRYVFLKILTDCNIYEILKGEIDTRFDLRNQGLSIIKGG